MSANELAIFRLIERTRSWRNAHRLQGNQIEATACAIREQAFWEALEIIGGPHRPNAVAQPLPRIAA